MKHNLSGGQQMVMLLLVLVLGPSSVLSQTVDIYNMGLDSNVDDINNQCALQPTGACGNQYNDVLVAKTKTDRCPALDKFVTCAKANCQQLAAFSSTYSEVNAYCGASSIGQAHLVTAVLFAFIVTSLF